MGRYRVKLPFDLDEWSPGGESRPVRLAKPYAGPEYGIHFPLHEGTEVMLSFVQGNPDRPYISGVMHDSAHTDHIPADWNTRNVIRTWANNKLRMEDLQGQEHIKLATDYQKSQLNLGHIVDSNRNKRGENGEGFELRTDGWGAVRAGNGILISADGKSPSDKVLNMHEAITVLEEMLGLAQSLDEAAQSAQNELAEIKIQREQLENSLKELKQAGIIQSAPNGIASATSKSQIHTAKEFINLVSGQDTGITSGKNFTVHAADSLNLFAQNSGMKIQANKGKVAIQAQNGELQINARKNSALTSTEGEITIASDKGILLVSQGAYIRIKNGEVEIGGPKMLRFRAPFHVTANHSEDYPLAIPNPGNDEMFVLKDERTGMPIPNFAYKITMANGEIYRGVTNEKGEAFRVYSGSKLEGMVFESDDEESREI